MSKKYYWIIDGKYYEVSKETYQKFKREYDHAKMLEEYENEFVVLSLDAVTSDEYSLSEVIPDTRTNVEDDVIHKILNEKMLSAREELPPDDKLLLELLFDKNMSQDEAAKIIGMSQSIVKPELNADGAKKYVKHENLRTADSLCLEAQLSKGEPETLLTTTGGLYIPDVPISEVKMCQNSTSRTAEAEVSELPDPHSNKTYNKIGRASCRERV